MQTFPDFQLVFIDPSQVNIYKNLARNAKVTISIDDSGDLCKNIENPSRSDELNLFQMMLRNSPKSVPIGQLLSSKKDAESVKILLNDWMERVKKAPDTAVMDGAGALHKACSEVFNKMELKSYLNMCWGVLRGLKFKAKTVIRIDRVHYSRMIRRHLYETLRLPKEIAELFFRSLCLAVDKTDVIEIFNIYINVIYLASKQFECQYTLYCRIYLESLIKGEERPSKLNFDIGLSNEFICEIIEAVEDHHSESLNINNTYYSPAVVKYCKYLGRLLPLWSPLISIVCDLRAEENSMDVESFFNTLKNIILEKVILRADQFLIEFQQHLKGQYAFDKCEYGCILFTNIIIRALN